LHNYFNREVFYSVFYVYLSSAFGIKCIICDEFLFTFQDHWSLILRANLEDNLRIKILFIWYYIQARHQNEMNFGSRVKNYKMGQE
jgi:hypothetical protein